MYGSYTAANSIELEALRGYTEVTGYLTISAGSAPSLEMLSSLTTVGETLTIIDTTGLTDLAGLGALTEVGGNLSLIRNSALTSLTSLWSLRTLGGINLYGNNSLGSLDGLEGLTDPGSGVTIRHHSALCQSAIDAYIDELVSGGWSGTTNFVGNAAC
jgi:hypothetical protein